MNKTELKHLGVSNRSKLRAAIEKGDKKAALALLEETTANETKLRNAIVGGMDAVLSFVADRLGEEAVCDAMKAWYTQELRPFIGAEAGEADAAERTRNRAYIWTGLHNVDIQVEEDHEKFTLRFPCDTGGVLAAKDCSGKMKSKFYWANREKGVAYYCTHCTVAYQVMFTEDFGFPDFIVCPPKKPGELCVQYVYKDPSRIPEEYRYRFPEGSKQPRRRKSPA